MVDQGVMWCFRTITWRFEWLYLVVGKFCHWAAFGGSGVLVCVHSFGVAT